MTVIDQMVQRPLLASHTNTGSARLVTMMVQRDAKDWDRRVVLP